MTVLQFVPRNTDRQQAANATGSLSSPDAMDVLVGVLRTLAGLMRPGNEDAPVMLQWADEVAAHAHYLRTGER